jgi:hypothetical protein
MMNPKVARFLAGSVALAAIAGFAVMYGRAIWFVFTSKVDPVTSKPEFVYVATALAGLVGGVVAMFFNEQLPDDTTGPQQRKNEPPTTPSKTGLKAAGLALKRSIYPADGRDRLFSIVSSIYVIVYFIIGVLAIIALVTASSSMPDLVKNLALISAGLFVAIARSFFHVPKPDSGKAPKLAEANGSGENTGKTNTGA